MYASVETSWNGQCSSRKCWPGPQLLPVTQFQDSCFQKCREKHPDIPLSELSNSPCGIQCQSDLVKFQVMNGWNPCQKRFQPPVLWYSK